jgi:Class II Aldolase and Adducin N-terminal domain
MVTWGELRREVWKANLGIFRAGLVTMHSGNASGIDRRGGRVLIKPSGMDYDRLRPADLMATDLEGHRVSGKWRPSVDLPHHLYLYRHRSEIGGIVHTHSNYATSFAALGRGIPAYLTAIADEFGEEIPCVPYADNQGDHIGEAILKHAGRAPRRAAGASRRLRLRPHARCGAQSRRHAGRRRQDVPPGALVGKTAALAAERSQEVVRALSHHLRSVQQTLRLRGPRAAVAMSSGLKRTD